MKTFQASKKWLLTIVALVFLGLAIWAVADEDPPLPIVENANDLCYEAPTDEGLLCLLGICGLHQETIPIHNRSGGTLTDVQAIIGTSELLNVDLVNYDCGIDNESGWNHACDYKDLLDQPLELDWLAALNLFGGGIAYDMPDYGKDDIHSIYAKSLITVDLFGGQNLYGEYIKNGVQYRGKINSCSIPVSPVYGNFNVERKTAANGDYRLYTQVAGKLFDLQAVFYENDFVTKTAFDGDVQVELVDAGVVSETSYSPANCRNFKSVDVNQTVSLNKQESKPFTVNTGKAVKNAAMRLWVLKYNNGFVDHHCTQAACYKSIYAQYYKQHGDKTCANSCKDNNNERECYECLVNNYAQAYCSRDNFAVRPNGLYLEPRAVGRTITTDGRLGDNSTVITSPNTEPATAPDTINPEPINLLADNTKYTLYSHGTIYNKPLNRVDNIAQGYRNEKIKSGLMTQFAESDLLKQNGFIGLLFDTTTGTSCVNTASQNIDASNKMLLPDVGKYKIVAVDNDWTLVDQARNTDKPVFAFDSNVKKDDCILYDDTPKGVDMQPGCTISSIFNQNDTRAIPATVIPAKFDMGGITLNSSPTVDKKWLYMNKIDDANKDTSPSIRYSGKLKAVNGNGVTTQNFVKGCAASPVNLNFNYSDIDATNIISGINTSDEKPWSTKGAATPDIGLISVINYTNNTVNTGVAAEQKSLTSNQTTPPIVIPVDAFIKSPTLPYEASPGEVDIDIAFNMDRYASKLMEPIEILFRDIVAQVADIFAANGNVETNTKGTVIHTGDTKKDATGADIAGQAYAFIYGTIYTDLMKAVAQRIPDETKTTTLSVVGYCTTGCSKFEKTNTDSPYKIFGDASNGWYTMVTHDADNDGKISKMTSDAPSLAKIDGAIEKLDVKFSNNGATPIINLSYPKTPREQTVAYTIDTDSWLQHNMFKIGNGNKPTFEINWVNNNALYNWVGKGNTGHVVNKPASANAKNRLNW